MSSIHVLLTIAIFIFIFNSDLAISLLLPKLEIVGLNHIEKKNGFEKKGLFIFFCKMKQNILLDHTPLKVSVLTFVVLSAKDPLCL